MTQPYITSDAAIYKGWQADISYAELPACFYNICRPALVKEPHFAIFNHSLAHNIGWTIYDTDPQHALNFCAGQLAHDHAHNHPVIAMAYAGHQFGHLNMLGDGRAHLLLEHVTSDNARLDVQLKGSGHTIYSRNGDGKAALAPMLREYIISEAMHHLNIKTTRSLAVVTTGTPIYRDTMQQGAILTRIAQSHLRVGTFEYAALRQNKAELMALANYAINRHYPNLIGKKDCYQRFLYKVMQAQITLIISWLRVGFIHGVMNTDNMTISGETIDYGPCAFMDFYNPNQVFSSIDHQGRYAFSNQASIARWNLARFAESMLPLLHDDIDKALDIANDIIQQFDGLYQPLYYDMMRAKCGLTSASSSDISLINSILDYFHEHDIDYTNGFVDLHYHLPNIHSTNAPTKSTNISVNGYDFTDASWYPRWQHALRNNTKIMHDNAAIMRQHNPCIIPRNHHVDHALKTAEQHGDMGPTHALIKALTNPYTYDNITDIQHYTMPPQPYERVLQTFCGT